MECLSEPPVADRPIQGLSNERSTTALRGQAENVKNPSTLAERWTVHPFCLSTKGVEVDKGCYGAEFVYTPRPLDDPALAGRIELFTEQHQSQRSRARVK
jgi:hypothetical protein